MSKEKGKKNIRNETIAKQSKLWFQTYVHQIAMSNIEKNVLFVVVGVRWAWANAVIHKLTRKASKQTSRERKNEKKNRRRRRFKLKLLGWMETVR